MRIANECLSRGHEVNVYTLSWQGNIPRGLKLHQVPVSALTKVGIYRRFTRWIEAELAKQEKHPVIGFNKMPLLDIHFAADPCFREKAEQQRGFYYQFTRRYRHFSEYEEAVFGESSNTRVMILSQQQEAAFSKYYPGCESRLQLVPPGISRDRKVESRDAIVRSELRKEFAIPEDSNLLLQIGSGFRVKGVDRSLKALASLPAAIRQQSHFMLVGQDKADQFIRLAKKLGVADNFTVLSGRDDIPRFLAAADLLLHPAYMESAGYVLLEATIAGLPVLTTASCGYALHIEQAQSGEVCAEPFSQEELNTRLVQMLQQLDSAPWSDNGLKYGRNEELYTMPERSVEFIEQFFH